MHGIFAPLPYGRNFVSIHGNTYMADYDSMSFFCSVIPKYVAEIPKYVAKNYAMDVGNFIPEF
jgi:hypothetical protein